jgi:hypothetical protein
MKRTSAFALGGLCGLVLSGLIAYPIARSAFPLGAADLVNAGRTFRALQSLRQDDTATAIAELEDSLNWTVRRIRVHHFHETSPRKATVVEFLRDVAEYRASYPAASGSTDSSEIERFLSDFR